VPAVRDPILNAIGTVIIVCIAVISTIFLGSSKVVSLQVDQAMLDRVESKYGVAARQRVVKWQKLMDDGKNDTELDKLQQVNDFFNQNIKFVDDLIVWLKNDYWATPIELLAKGAGDCEDFSIAKYFTLVEMGIDENKLRITYVKALALNQAHMVLTYFESPIAVPLVLDNLKPTISPATDRKDLLPVYSFNGSGLWLAKIKSSGQQFSNPDRLNLWADLKQRMLEKAF
jgi:predicted transglutaminase-like cysteine proteinase